MTTNEVNDYAELKDLAKGIEDASRYLYCGNFGVTANPSEMEPGADMASYREAVQQGREAAQAALTTACERLSAALMAAGIDGRHWDAYWAGWIDEPTPESELRTLADAASASGIRGAVEGVRPSRRRDAPAPAPAPLAEWEVELIAGWIVPDLFASPEGDLHAMAAVRQAYSEGVDLARPEGAARVREILGID